MYQSQREKEFEKRGLSLQKIEPHIFGLAQQINRTPLQVYDALLIFLDATKPYVASKSAVKPADFCDLCGNPVPDDGFQHKSIRCEECCKPVAAP